MRAISEIISVAVSLNLRDVVTSIPQLNDGVASGTTLPALSLCKCENRWTAWFCTVALMCGLLAPCTSAFIARSAQTAAIRRNVAWQDECRTGSHMTVSPVEGCHFDLPGLEFSCEVKTKYFTHTT